MTAIKNDKPNRSVFFDLLKATAIITVVLYHFELMQYGYLGVDVFLVVAGYLTGKSIRRSREKGEFGYFGFLIKRVIRLLPLLLIAAAVCLLVGCFLMLPDDYENLAESVIATNFFSNNILQCITTKNYWDVVNNYKPLMHTWYLGVLFEAYIIIALVPSIGYKVLKRKESGDKIIAAVLTGISIISLVLYLLPRFSQAYRFYMIPFRLYEVGFGCAIAFFGIEKNRIKHKGIAFIVMTAMFAALFLMMVPSIPIGDSIRLLAVVFSTCGLIILYQCSDPSLLDYRITRYIAYIGKASLSIYIWHQIVIAFFRYSIAAKPTALQYVGIFAFVGLLSAVSYRMIEKQDFSPQRNKRKYIPVIGMAVMLAVTTAFSGLIYLRSGVIRDVPELEISKINVQRGMHKKYNDAVYQMQVPFSDGDETKILVIGDSFARDWVNILKESDLENIDISYYYYTQTSNILDCADLIEQADIIFFSTFSDYETLPAALETRFNEKEIYVVGVKNFGESNGIIYKNRGRADYADQTVRISDEYIVRNERQKKQFGDRFIDMLAPVLTDDGSIIVFTPDCRFISQDCRHLTHAGAVFYSQKLDLSWITDYGRD